MLQRETLTLGLVCLLTLATLTGIATPTPDTNQPATVSSHCEFPLTVTDATGTNVTIETTPDRVVVLGASATQTIWEIGQQNTVVGIDAFATYLNGSGDIPIVSQGIGQVDYEAALNQNPDLIIIDGNSYEDAVATEFRQSDVPVVKLQTVSSLPGVINKTERLGRLLGACTAANQTATTLAERIETVRTAVNGEPTPSLFYDLGNAQGSARFSVGPNTFIGEIITTAGATNIVSLGNFSRAYPQVSNEFILRENPEWLLVTYTPGSQFGPSTPAQARAAVANSSVLSETQAFENNNIIVVNANNLNQPAPRVVQALTKIAATIHPDAYAAANTTTTTTQPTTTTTTETATPTTTTTTTGSGGPGFTTTLTLVAITVALGIGLRRA